MKVQEYIPARIALIDCGIGNLASVDNALTFLGAEIDVIADNRPLGDYDGIVLPGVGAFAEAAKNLTVMGLRDSLSRWVVEEKKLFLGICVGMQMVFERSHENGTHEGFGWLQGEVRRFSPQLGVRIPHVGWSAVEQKKKTVLFDKIPDRSTFYFDHSYCIETEESYVAATVQHGVEVAAFVEQDNIFAAQYHPEKSQLMGLRQLKSFLQLAYAGGENA